MNKSVMLIFLFALTLSVQATEMDIDLPGGKSAHATPAPDLEGPLPQKPQNLKVKVEGQTVILSWDPVKRVRGYKLYVSKNGKNYLCLNAQPFQATTCTLRHVSPDKTYYFAVSSLSENGRESEKVYQKLETSNN